MGSQTSGGSAGTIELHLRMLACSSCNLQAKIASLACDHLCLDNTISKQSATLVQLVFVKVSPIGPLTHSVAITTLLIATTRQKKHILCFEIIRIIGQYATY